MINSTSVAVAAMALALAPALSAATEALEPLPGHRVPAAAQLQPFGDLPATNRLRLVLGLPLRHEDQLNTLLAGLNDPAGTNYHRWLTPAEFSERFGPSPGDYEKVVAFARAQGLQVTGLVSNRMLVDAEAPVATIERAFHLKFHLYRHPAELRSFFAPDAEPLVDPNLPLAHVSGLDDFILPHRLGSFRLTALATNQGVTSLYTGSAPGGYFMGRDFRAAYVPGVTNSGAGQYIAIADVGGLYYSNDIYLYETNAGLSTNIVVTNIVTTVTSYWTNALTGSSTDDGEESLDICMALSMAPAATIMNYEGDAHDVFNRIAADNKAKQITLSYGFGIDVSIVQSFQQFLAQGQALSQASGDGDADLDGGTGLTGNPYATIVGGTTLVTSGAGGAWSSESAWNWNNGGGSGGGISGYGIPNWQQGVATSTNLASTVYRNYPDVAMPADGVFLVSRNGTSVGWVGGTSCASPLWAGFMALVNQQAASLGKPAVGFPNPALYGLGKGPYAAYTNAFHDIVTGNNYNSQNPARFPAAAGYDLCTGWGTPRGSNTLVALAGAGTNDFTLYASPDGPTVVPGAAVVSTITVAGLNGFGSTVSLIVSGLPPGIAMALNPPSTTGSSRLTLTAGRSAVPGSYPLTITGTGAGLTHSVPLTLTVAAPIPGAVPVNLSANYNRSGIWTDGSSFGGGLDGGGYAYSASLLGLAPGWNGLVYTLGPANSLNAVSCSGQVIALPQGSFTSLQILGSAVDGNQAGQTFIVTYTDNSTATFTQSLSDWAYPQHYAGESVVLGMAYRNTGGGNKDLYTAVNLYNYGFTLDQTKTVKSLTLPNNGNVVLLAAMLANQPVTVPLAAWFNRAGIYSDGVTFTNPATGGMDGGGAAYSASLLTGSQTWSNTIFSFGPANVTNVVSAAGQAISLPAGNYSVLRMLATGVQGNQVSQLFAVKYADGTSGSFFQNLSDWYTPQTYAGEAKAVTMGHRNKSDGTKDGSTFYLYGYSFKLNPAKVVQSLTLPSDANVIVTAVSLVPNWPPVFALNPFTEPATTAGQGVFINIATNATDANGDTLTFGKVSGPSWLAVSTRGILSGTPLSAQVGTNSFLVSVSDAGNLSNTATMNIAVQPAPAIVSAWTSTPEGGWLSWTGGIAPYQLQMSTNLTGTNWVNWGDPVSSNSFKVVPSNPAAFFRIGGQ